MILGIISMSSNAQAESQPSYLQLVDRLDRPQDGYCIDILGAGDHLRFDQPLIAHNCARRPNHPDETLVMRDDGTIVFPIADRCITVAGVNTTALPSAPLMLHVCGKQSPFVNAPAMQKFLHRADGRIQLMGSNLCMTVGNESDQTYSPIHRWRQLYMEKCSLTDPARSTWKFFVSDEY